MLRPAEGVQRPGTKGMVATQEWLLEVCTTVSPWCRLLRLLTLILHRSASTLMQALRRPMTRQQQGRVSRQHRGLQELLGATESPATGASTAAPLQQDRGWQRWRMRCSSCRRPLRECGGANC